MHYHANKNPNGERKQKTNPEYHTIKTTNNRTNRLVKFAFKNARNGILKIDEAAHLIVIIQTKT
jgi:hypothetical protein